MSSFFFENIFTLYFSPNHFHPGVAFSVVGRRGTVNFSLAISSYCRGVATTANILPVPAGLFTGSGGGFS
jgi:hypothetical protein